MTIQFVRGTHYPQGCVAAIGNFDGMHKGHCALITLLKKRAEALQAPTLVITFEPLPKEYLLGTAAPPRLISFREKVSGFVQLGIDYIMVLPFNKKIAALSPAEFVQTLLVEKLHIKHVIVGDDFHFGKKRSGDFHFMKAYGERAGFTAECLPGVFAHDERISSTRIRELLMAGQCERVLTLLGHAYTRCGKVVRGEQRGRQLGYPTANIYLRRAMCLPNGIYAVRMRWGQRSALAGVASWGVRPTIGKDLPRLLEVHLFDFADAIYGERVWVEFYSKLRDEKHFDNIQALTEQMHRDVCQAKNSLAMILPDM